jgi:HEPN domain-containing protein
MGVPLDEAEYRRWREDAERTLASARHQLEGGYFNWACFTAEQAAQQAVKALLHGMGRAPWGHDLLALLDSVATAGLTVPAEAREGALRLARHYIPARYPDAHAAGPAAARYGAADAKEGIADAATVLAFVDAGWGRLHGG